MSWEDILKISTEDAISDAKRYAIPSDVNNVIYEGRGGRDGRNAEEVIKENDPELYQKLEGHFESHPLTNHDYRNQWDEHDKEFHWSEAFSKYGMEDGEYEELSEEVADYLIELGYKVRMTNAITHNTYIKEVMWTDKVKL